MRALLAFVVLLSLASCGRSTGYPPAYEVNFMRACEARSTVPGLCACTWGKIEAEVPADEFAALERLAPAERSAHPRTRQINDYALECARELSGESLRQP